MMQAVEPVVQPSPGRALVKVHRARRFVRWALQFEIWDGVRLAGIASNGTTVYYECDPGDHLFVVKFRSAIPSAVRARLEAGKTYSMVVSGRSGFWKIRLLLVPVAKSLRKLGEFDAGLQPTVLDRDSAAAFEAEHRPEIRNMIQKYGNTLWREPVADFGEGPDVQLGSTGAIADGRVKEAKPAAVGPAEPSPVEGELASIRVPGDVSFGDYHALVIGIDGYRSLPRLRTAVNDARSVAKTLKDDYGFETRLLLDATRADILNALGDFRRSLTPRDNLLIYYAGHGWLDEEADAGYWLPVDATRDSEVNWVSNASVTSAVKAIPAKHVLVVADSCYSGKLTRGLRITRRTRDYFARIAGKRARLVLASGGLEPVADAGGEGRHSVFASAFLQALRENEGVMDGTLLFTRIRRPVMLNSDQAPEYADIRKAGHAGGDFLFVRGE